MSVSFDFRRLVVASLAAFELPRQRHRRHDNKNTKVVCALPIYDSGRERISVPHSQQLTTQRLRSKPRLSIAAASASSSTVAEPEEWFDEERKQRRPRIAGVDQEELLDPTLLADPDSCFCEFKGVQIHHKICNDADADSGTRSSQKQVGLPMILLHGFGASLFSWSQVMKPLAQVTGSEVLAFDRPAFGLTSREYSLRHSSSPCDKDTITLNPYSMAFSILATLYFVDFLGAEKAILVGHSAGSLVAINSYFEAPERIAALILIAPAILAPLVTQNIGGNRLGRDNSMQDNISNSNTQKMLLTRIFMMLKIFECITDAIVQLAKGIVNMISCMYKKVLLAILRSSFVVILVRTVIDKLGVATIRSAWYDSNKVTNHVLHGYTKPLRTKGWDKALVDYIAAMLTDSAYESKLPLAKRLREISCPVLLITGDNDRIVPTWNTRRLSRAIPGSSLQVIKHCGHLPHEERKEEFVRAIQNFMDKVFSSEVLPCGAEI